MKKAVVTTLFCLTLTAALGSAAYAKELVAGGQVVGIEMSTDGVMVEGVGEVETKEGSCCPAEEAGLKEGDLITEVNGQKLTGAGELIDMVAEADGESVQLKVQRDGRIMRFKLQPALSDEEQWRLGMWLRDGISGIGTVTFFDPESGIYGALGHGISDLDTGEILPLQKGSISEAQIAGICKGATGTPGELKGCADKGETLGSIEKNTSRGIYGKSFGPMEGRTYLTGEITTGPATIISTVNGSDTEEFKVEINRVYRDPEGERVMLTVTDPGLCAKTGGIVQGMSGSPIIQQGKLVGAVTHVFVNDPKRGYGISIDSMLDAAA